MEVFFSPYKFIVDKHCIFAFISHFLKLFFNLLLSWLLWSLLKNLNKLFCSFQITDFTEYVLFYFAIAKLCYNYLWATGSMGLSIYIPFIFNCSSRETSQFSFLFCDAIKTQITPWWSTFKVSEFLFNVTILSFNQF